MIDTKTICYLVFAIVFNSCSVKISTIESNAVYETRQLSFSQAVVFKQVIYSSGQVGWDKEFKLPSKPDFENQFEQSLQNIEHLLEHEGCSWQDVLLLRFYVVDLNATKRKEISSFLQQTYLEGYAPATSVFGVSALARENLQIEIEFTAKINYK